MLSQNNLNLNELKLEVLSDELENLLTEDAFKLPERKHETKEDADENSICVANGYVIPVTEYKELYGQLPVWGYINPKIENKKIIVNKLIYREQFFILIDKIKIWGALNTINSELLNTFDLFKNQFFQPEYSENQTSDYFILIKQNLEIIWSILFKNKTISQDYKNKEFKNLCEKIGVCPSGTFTHICDTTLQLLKDNSIEFVLAKWRKNLTDWYAESYNELNNLYEGNEVHISTALYSYQNNQGWGPFVNISKIHEQYGAQFMGIDEKIFINFHQYFSGSYTPHAIFKCVILHCQSEMQSELNQVSLKHVKINKETGWMEYNQEYMDAAIKVSNYVGANFQLLLDYNEDNHQMIYAPESVGAKFLKFCREENKFYRSHLWFEQKLNDEFKDYKFICCGNNYKMLWVEGPNNTVINWSRGEQITFKCKLIGKLISTLTEEKDFYEAKKQILDIVEVTVNDLKKIIKTRTDLENLLSPCLNAPLHKMIILAVIGTGLTNIYVILKT